MTDTEFVENAESLCFSSSWTKNDIEALLKSEGGIFLLSEENGERTGYVLGNSVLDEAELYRIAVLPQHRKKGEGKKLLDRFIAVCRRRAVSRVFLEVRSKNIPARSMYERAGFKAIGVRKKYYGDDDAVVYSLDMSGSE